MTTNRMTFDSVKTKEYQDMEEVSFTYSKITWTLHGWKHRIHRQLERQLSR